MENVRFSIIIPAYNCGGFIADAIKSVQEQSYGNFEIVVVNDGSSDDTAAVVEKLASADNRIKLVSKENGGPAKARNTGIASAEGEYLMFLDSDDVYSQGFLEEADRLIEKDGSELLVFGFEQIFTVSGCKKRFAFENMHLEKYTDFGEKFAAVYKSNILNQVWNKVVKKSLITENNIQFPDYRYGEDRLFVADVIEHSRGISISDKVFYNYIIDGDVSLISSYYDKKADVCLEIYERFSALNAACRKNADNSNIKYMFLKSILSCLTVLFSGRCKLSRREKRDAVRKVICNKKIIKALRGKIGGGAAVKIIRAVISSGCVGLNILLSKFVLFTQMYFMPLYLKFRD